MQSHLCKQPHPLSEIAAQSRMSMKGSHNVGSPPSFKGKQFSSFEQRWLGHWVISRLRKASFGAHRRGNRGGTLLVTSHPALHSYRQGSKILNGQREGLEVWRSLQSPGNAPAGRSMANTALQALPPTPSALLDCGLHS